MPICATASSRGSATSSAIRFLRQFQDQLYTQTDRYWYGWLAKADVRQEVQYFYYEVEESLRALAVNDFDALGMIRRNHISMMLTRAEGYRKPR